VQGPVPIGEVNVYAMVCAPYSGTRGGDQRAARTPRRLPTRGQPGEVIAARRERPPLFTPCWRPPRDGWSDVPILRMGI